ncbi:MAG: hypothetical protein A2158_02585 [Chloroflexi bacterium RBG_13_46_14]|nr:MAG: hypothetical protein A2158_02585 [Chloroflexi bacterium RBG_13_46_14]
MNRKLWLYSGLMVVVLALMGFGIWFVLNPGNKVKIPEEAPVVLVDFNNPENGTLSQLSVYEDGTVIYVEDSGEIEGFFSYLESIDFYEIETTFISPGAFEGIPEDRGTSHVVPGGLVDYIRIFADNGQAENAIEIIGYISTGADLYTELPSPTKYIYEELAEIIVNKTEEVLVQELIR